MRFVILSLIFILSFSVIAAEQNHISEIAKAKPVHGEAQTADSLKGKVILFEYWGFN